MNNEKTKNVLSTESFNLDKIIKGRKERQENQAKEKASKKNN
ncbi:MULTISPECIES: hypothetical protein [unclassified Campylobacter]|nr:MULTISPECIES: hypothetical protein [unclassified Campylobacter]